MARLSAEQKIFIVQRLACFDTPDQVAKAVKETFGIDIARQSCEVYDPTKVAGKDLSEKLKIVFYDARKNFISQSGDIAISHMCYRLRALDRMSKSAEARGNYPLAAQLLEQAAKEVGGQYTNTRKHELTGKDGKPIESFSAKQYSNDELDRRIAELSAKVGNSDRG